jgi:hypothetical protein
MFGGAATIWFLILWAMPRVGLSIAWSTALPFAGGLAALLVLLVYLWRVPGTRKEWRITEVLTAFFLLLLYAQVLMPAQYVAVALREPLVDRQLAGIDALFGVHVVTYAAWMAHHPAVNRAFAIAYYSFVPQLVVLPLLLGFVLDDRDAMWEYVFLFSACSSLAVIGVALWPAADFQYLSTFNLTHAGRQFDAVRSGTLRIIRFNDMDGLVSIPSLHAAVGAMGIWALRRHRRLFAGSCVLNGVLIIATFLSGSHYLVDTVAGLAMVGGCIVVWQVGVDPIRAGRFRNYMPSTSRSL